MLCVKKKSTGVYYDIIMTYSYFEPERFYDIVYSMSFIINTIIQISLTFSRLKFKFGNSNRRKLQCNLIPKSY